MDTSGSSAVVRRRIKIAIAVVFVLLNVADNLTTMDALHLGGGLVEGNPVMAFVQWLAGEWWPIVKILAASAIAWTWVHANLPYAIPVFGFATAVLAVVVWNNWTLIT